MEAPGTLQLCRKTPARVKGTSLFGCSVSDQENPFYSIDLRMVVCWIELSLIQVFLTRHMIHLSRRCKGEFLDRECYSHLNFSIRIIQRAPLKSILISYTSFSKESNRCSYFLSFFQTTKCCSGQKPTHLTSVFTLRTSVFLTSWYYAEGIDTNVKYGCSRMLDGLVSSHPKCYLYFTNIKSSSLHFFFRISFCLPFQWCPLLALIRTT